MISVLNKGKVPVKIWSPNEGLEVVARGVEELHSGRVSQLSPQLCGEGEPLWIKRHCHQKRSRPCAS